jgi:hypothetical protein
MKMKEILALQPSAGDAVFRERKALRTMSRETILKSAGGHSSSDISDILLKAKPNSYVKQKVATSHRQRHL